MTSRRSMKSLSVAAALAAFAGSCATPPLPDAPSQEVSETVPMTPASGPKVTALRKAAEAERTAPRQAHLPPPPYLDSSLLTPVPPASGPDDPSFLTLDAALQKVIAQAPAAAPEAAALPAQEEARRQALRLYTSGRMKLLRGDSSGAILDLESATRLDPAAPAPWRELAEAQIAQGKRLASITSLQKAVDRGLVEPRSLWLLGRDALRSGKFALAASYLARSAAARPDQADVALRYLVYVDLAEALEKSGYLRAATEAFATGLTFPDQFSSTSRLRVEFADLYRRRGELWLRAGDIACRLGDYESAGRAYAESAAYAASDPDEAIVRLVFALQQSGRPTTAAAAVLDRIELQRGSAGEKMLDLVRHLSADRETARLLRDAVDELATALEAGAPPTVLGDLSLLRAASLDQPESLEVLRKFLARYPSNTTVLNRLLNQARQTAPGGELDVLVSLAEQSPAHTSKFVHAALGAGIDADAATAALTGRADSDSHALLLATLHAQLGRPDAAWAIAESRNWSPQFAPAGLLLKCSIAASSGRWQQARAAFDAIVALPPQTPDRASLVILAGAAMQRPDLALAASPGPETTESVDILLDTANFALLTGNPREAELRAKRAAYIDPFDERPYAMLLGMFGSDGPLTDQARLTETARLLREAVPSSRTLRSVFAREMIQRSPDAQAEQMLLSLAEEDITDADNGRTLINLWERLATGPAQPGAKAPPRDTALLQRAEEWLRIRARTRPEVPWLWTGLARILVAQGRAVEAEELISTRYAVRPLVEFAQLREAIIRDRLGRPADADALTRARVETAPRSIDASIEYADLLTREKKPSEALAVLRDGLPDSVALTESQILRLSLLMSQAGKVVEATRGVSPDAAWAQLFESAASRSGARLPPQLHATRISLLARTDGIPPEQVLSAAAAAAAQYPTLAPNFYLAAAVQYASSTQPRRSLPFFITAIKQSASPSGELLYETVRQIVVHGDAADAKAFIDEISEPAKVTALLAALRAEGPIPTEPHKLRAEFAYHVGNGFASQNKEADSLQCYRLALQFDPDHAWSMNNLGYSLVESGDDIAEASRLLERAVVLLPEEANVLDSLGWLRYMQGAFEDSESPAGKVEGAISLLRRAAASAKGEANATVFNHLGDALWAANRKEEAAKAWEQAESLAMTDLARLQSAQNPSRPAIDVASKELESIRARRKAVLENTEPPIEPRHPTGASK